jgi:hypothetical protein
VSRLGATAFFVGTFTLLHALASVGTYLWSIKRAMEISYRFAPRSWLDSALEIVSNILLSPLFALVFHLRFQMLRGAGAYLAVLSNSFLWALVVWWLVVRFRRKRVAET